MKFGELIEYNKIIYFFKNYLKIEAERLVPDLFLFSEKDYYETKESGLQLSFNMFQ